MEPPFTFVDAHCHFWDTRNLACPWLVEVPSIAGPHTTANLRAEAGPLLASQIVFVQAGTEPPEAEVAWVEGLAATEPRIAAIVAFTPVDRGADTVAALEALRRRPLVKGIRHLIQDQPDPRFCLRPAFVDGVRAVSAAGFSFDLCIRHHQLPAVTELARACPETSFVLDHVGKPAIHAGQLDPWREQIGRLAELSNVTCKLSGLVTEANVTAWTPADLRPFVEHVVQVFGPERLMYGSDWPVVKLASGYTAWLETARGFLSALSPTAQRAIFSETARRVYRLPHVTL